MRNRVAVWVLALICLLAAGAARAEAVWVREDWQQLTGEYDCGGVRLSVDARAMILPAGATVQSYRAPRLSRARLIALGEAIDWAALGLDTAQGSWRNPTAGFPEYAFFARSGYPYAAVGAPGSVQLALCPPEQYGTDGVNLYAAGLYDFAQDPVAAQAGLAARVCKLQLGDAVRVRILPSGAADAWYPVYVNGLRLYAGVETGSDPGNTREVWFSSLRVTVEPAGRLIALDGPLLDAAAMTPITPAAAPIAAADVIPLLQQRYAAWPGEGLASVTVYEIALEYVLTSKNTSSAAKQGFTLRPVWAVRVLARYHDGFEIMTHVLLDAATGQAL